LPSTAITARWSRAFGSGAAALQVPERISKTSCAATTIPSGPRPPITWIFPSTIAAPAAPRGVGMGGRVRHALPAGSYANAVLLASLWTGVAKPPSA
jgi:hypothetical protein